MKRALITILSVAVLAAFCYLYLKAKTQERLPFQPIVVNPWQDMEDLWNEARAHPSLAGSALGLCVLDQQGQTVFGKNEELAFIPASTLKTVTTATALELWGPEFRLKTSFRATAALNEGILRGDLIMEGGGDPMLSLGDLEAIADQLRESGLKEIHGRIIGDGGLFRGSIYDDFWNWGDIGNGYGSAVCGLNLEHNRFTASFQAATELGQKAQFLGVQPEVPDVAWISEVLTAGAESGDGVVIHGGERTRRIYFRGTAPLRDQSLRVVGAVPDPELYAAHHFQRLLRQAGVKVTGEAVAGSAVEMPLAPNVLHVHESPRLIEIITSIHDTSDNHETECLYRLLGLKEGRAPDLVVRDYWQSRGLRFQGLRMEDGCGLARADFIRPLDLARLQHWAGSGDQGELYRQSLLSTPDGAVRWKGGAMSGVRSYVGFIRTDSGQTRTFALMVNHFTDGSAIAGIRDRFIQALKRR